MTKFLLLLLFTFCARVDSFFRETIEEETQEVTVEDVMAKDDILTGA
jgi:hypothetical protein